MGRDGELQCFCTSDDSACTRWFGPSSGPSPVDVDVARPRRELSARRVAELQPLQRHHHCRGGLWWLAVAMQKGDCMLCDPLFGDGRIDESVRGNKSGGRKSQWPRHCWRCADAMSRNSKPKEQRRAMLDIFESYEAIMDVHNPATCITLPRCKKTLWP